MLRDDRTGIACESAYSALPSARTNFVVPQTCDDAGMAGWRISPSPPHGAVSIRETEMANAIHPHSSTQPRLHVRLRQAPTPRPLSLWKSHPRRQPQMDAAIMSRL